MKYIFSTTILFLCYFSIAQKLTGDTVWIRQDYREACTSSFNLTASGGKYDLNGKEITEQKFDEAERFIITVCDSIVFASHGKYCKFYIKDSVVIEEGRWHVEFFSGAYKNYYPDGQIKTSGQFRPEKYGDNAGEKMGTWFFYSKHGKVRKKVNYTP